jgi:hypothetical protein
MRRHRPGTDHRLQHHDGERGPLPAGLPALRAGKPRGDHSGDPRWHRSRVPVISRRASEPVTKSQVFDLQVETVARSWKASLAKHPTPTASSRPGRSMMSATRWTSATKRDLIGVPPLDLGT